PAAGRWCLRWGDETCLIRLVSLVIPANTPESSRDTRAIAPNAKKTNLHPTRKHPASRHHNPQQRRVLLAAENVGVAGTAAWHQPVDRELDRVRRIELDKIRNAR